MRLDSADADEFKKFDEYLRTDFAQLANNGKIVKAIHRAGKFPDDDHVQRLIRFGHTPKITITGGLVHGEPSNMMTNIPGLYAMGECAFGYHGAMVEPHDL